MSARPFVESTIQANRVRYIAAHECEKKGGVRLYGNLVMTEQCCLVRYVSEYEVRLH